jgi:Tol biopolymer transport system component
MPPTAGTRFGPYEIIAAIGAGGMGEVYKARDTRLDRTVAIKILAAHLASSSDLRERFDREARVVSSLNHPNICVVHDVGHDQGVDYLVMEYLEGETLAARLEKGPLPLADVLRYGGQIADALDRAHRQGIVHRDLKPANVMLTKSGVKLLDFGLAKLAAGTQTGSSGVFTPSMPTAEHGLTAQGSILGTFQYMAPEQLEGADADARTDIFAFGTVLYEMATGRKAFEGKTHASLIGAILKDQPPPISTVQALTPPALDDLVTRCLAKDPDERWQSARDIASQVRWIQQSSSQIGAAVRAKRRRYLGARTAWAVAIFSAAAAAALAVPYFRPKAPASLVRFTIGEPTGGRFFPGVLVAPFPVVSPDGRHIAFIAAEGPTDAKLFVRSLDTPAARSMPGTDNAALPFWSADNRFVGFFASGAIKRSEIATGEVQTICNIETFEGGTWNAEGVVLFSKGRGGLFRVDATGGEPAPATTLESTSSAGSHRWPMFLPDGRHYLFLAQPGNDVYYGGLDSTAPKRLVRAEARAVYSVGYLLYGKDGTLLAHRFDAARGEVSGEPVRIADNVRMSQPNGRATYTASDDGVLVYREGNFRQSTVVSSFDRKGKRIDAVLPEGDNRGFALSPDGRRVAFHRHDSDRGGDIWVKDLVRGTITRITTHPSHNASPAWLADGRIAFLSDRAGLNDIYVKSASGTGDDELLYESRDNESSLHPARGSPLIAFAIGGVPGATGSTAEGDIGVLRLGNPTEAESFLRTPFAEFQPAFSPDGKWIAYTSNESGRHEVYVQPYSANGTKYPISTAGGIQPRWSRDGGELFFLTHDSTLMVVTIARTPAFDASVPRALFQTALTPAQRSGFHSYDISPDGQRILIGQLKDPERLVAVDPLVVVLNWTALLPKH